ncbi:MAG TPA: glutamate--tRNA ligase [Acidimicrobiales bacterium]|nr:glutamate--tRNA ligase [Acidimicrobiales bacterium]
MRLAPSPTGYFHVGTARTALFNWILAKQDPEGVFILRVEDTDPERNREEWVQAIYAAMAWLGLDYTGPFRQSENAPAHAAALEALVAAGALYYCDCTPAEVEARKGARATPGYDGYCRDRGLARNERTALRFRTPDEGTIVVPDLVRGEVVFSLSAIDDFVVARSTGEALYALANVVDDRDDAITHVVRGEEHLANAPKQMMLWSALNAATGLEVSLPVFAHLPLLVNEQRKKLSKRRDPVALEMYRDQGYLVAAVLNYLALLGWSPRGDDEIVEMDTIVEQFRLEDVSHSPAFFDVKKLTAFNGTYIRALSPEAFAALCRPWVDPGEVAWRPAGYRPAWGVEDFDPDLFARLVPLIQERVARLDEVPVMVDFFFGEPAHDEAAFAKAITSDPAAPGVLAAALEAYGALGDFGAEALHAATLALGEARGLSLRKAQAPIRCAVTGRLVGPPLFESLALLGRERTLARLRAALEHAA